MHCSRVSPIASRSARTSAISNSVSSRCDQSGRMGDRFHSSDPMQNLLILDAASASRLPTFFIRSHKNCAEAGQSRHLRQEAPQIERQSRLVSLRSAIYILMLRDYRGKVAVITGAGGGLGRALGMELAARRCDLALIDTAAAGHGGPNFSVPCFCDALLRGRRVTDGTGTSSKGGRPRSWHDRLADQQCRDFGIIGFCEYTGRRV